MHIEELLKLKVIRESRSPHRSTAFIVRNHAEEVRGKSRMVINYKRLNDNSALCLPGLCKSFALAKHLQLNGCGTHGAAKSCAVINNLLRILF